MLYSKKKECSPENTISNIQNKLENLGFQHSYEINNSNLSYYNSSLHSCRILINGLYTSNGKGTDEKYSLASGYAELMERMQNCRLPGVSPFNVFSDILNIDIDEYFKDDFDIKKNFILDLDVNSFASSQTNKNNLDYRKIIKKWFGEKSSLKCLKFYDALRKREIILPYELSLFYTASNGMSSGNTTQEALVQGISEIFERHVQKEILKNELVCPIIPSEMYNKYDIITKMLNEYEQLGFKVQIRDASLGKGFPVVCVVLIDVKNGRHAVGFGTHPLFPIALERVLTELAQGVNKENLSTFSSTFFYSNFPPNENYKNKPSNILQLFFQNAKRTFPIKFYSQNYSWEFDRCTWQDETKSNQNLLEYYIKLISSLGYDIYIRDCSFLGFPAYYTVIPQMSSIIPNRDFDLDNTFSLHLSYKYPSNSLLLPLVNSIKNKRFNFSYSYIQFLTKVFINDNSKQDLMKELTALKQIIAFMLSNLSSSDIKYYSELFFGEEMINTVYTKWLGTDNPAQFWGISQEDKIFEEKTNYIEKILRENYSPVPFNQIINALNFREV